MYKRIMALFISVFLLVGISFSAFAQQEDLKEVQDSVKAFSEALAKSLPFNSALGLNWSDAYIGKITDGHFGVGISAGVTTMDMAPIKRAASNFGVDIPLDWGKMPFPGYTVEGRIGGFSLPFDIGLKFGILPSLNLFDINLNYLQVGGDLRFAIMDGISKPLLPNFSLGVGVNYLKGGIGATANIGRTLTYEILPGTPLASTERIVLGDADVNLEWNTVALDVKAQISKTFAILTPYLGLGGSYAMSSAGYSVDSEITRNGTRITTQDIAQINEYLRFMGIDEVDISPDGISSTIKRSDFSVRAFLGTSLNLAAFRLDLTGLYSILDGNFGGSVGLRFQL